jgi:hypothetical protein
MKVLVFEHTGLPLKKMILRDTREPRTGFKEEKERKFPLASSDCNAHRLFRGDISNLFDICN